MFLDLVAFVIVLGRATVVSGSVYYFEPNYNFEYMNNWVDDALPCEDDKIRIDQQKIAVTMIGDEGIKFSEMLLPDDGIIFFAPNMVIGHKANWQCDKRVTPEDASFITKQPASFFNGSNWLASVEGKETGFLLNALQVPSAEDTAVIQASGSNRMLIDDFIELNAFQFSNELTTEKVFDLSALWTMEGQFQFVLAPKLKSEVIIDDVQYQWPQFTNTITISTDPIEKRSIFGHRNSNLRPNVMKIICSYQRCPNAEDNCVSPIHPVGHCCPTCGSMLTFRGTGINFVNLLEQLRLFQIGSAFVHIFHLDVSLLRIDDNEMIPEYQIVVLGPQNETFDERVYYETLKEVIEVLYRSYDYTNAMSLFDLKKAYSRDLRGFGIADAIIVLFFLCVIMAAIFAVTITIKQYHVNPRMRQMILQQSSAIHALAVRWRGGKTEEDDQLELLSGSVTDQDDYATIGSDEENTYEEPRSMVNRKSDSCTQFANENFIETKHQQSPSTTLIDDSVL